MKEFHLSSTQIHIINQLLDAHEPLSSQFLANGLGVSSKTIRKRKTCRINRSRSHLLYKFYKKELANITISKCRKSI